MPAGWIVGVIELSSLYQHIIMLNGGNQMALADERAQVELPLNRRDTLIGYRRLAGYSVPASLPELDVRQATWRYLVGCTSLAGNQAPQAYASLASVRHPAGDSQAERPRRVPVWRAWRGQVLTSRYRQRPLGPGPLFATQPPGTKCWNVEALASQHPTPCMLGRVHFWRSMRDL